MGSVVSSMANGNYSLSGSPYTQCLQQGALNLGNLAAINSVQNGIYGIYSHFSLYNRVLSSGEVSRLYSYLKTQMSWRGVSLP